MSTSRLVIVADDLTGAADSAARCVHAGLSAEIWIESADHATNAQVVSLSTDSRCLSPDQAAQRVVAALVKLAQWEGVTWYKKIDSTLRGNLGAEIGAMLGALPDAVAVICPAFPAQGRGLEDGKLVCAGVPSHHLPTLLAEQSALPIGEVGLATLRQASGALAASLRHLAEQGRKLIVVDAMTDADLGAIMEGTQGGNFLLCGSAGMVAPLAARWMGKNHKASGSGRVQAGPILALVGSGSAVAHAQVAEVAAASAMRVRAIDNGWYQADLVGAQSHPTGDWLLYLMPPDDVAVLEGAVARAHAARLADLAFAAVERLQPAALVVVGGDTAHYVLQRLGIEKLTVVEELLPGIPLTVGTDNTGQARAVVLKPGSFGDAKTLLALQSAIHERQR